MTTEHKDDTPIQEANKAKKQAGLPSAFSLYKPSFDAVMVNIWTFLGLLLAPFGAYALVNIAGTANGTPELSGGTGMLLVATYMLSLLVYPALPYLQLQSSQGKEVSIGEAFRVGLKHFWRFYGLTLLSTFVIFFGLLLLIVPGLYMIRRYLLAPYYMYDRNLGVLESMKASAADSKHFAGSIWGLFGVTLLNSLPSVVPILGWFVSGGLIVTYYCAPALRYLQIKEAAKKS